MSRLRLAPAIVAVIIMASAGTAVCGIAGAWSLAFACLGAALAGLVTLSTLRTRKMHRDLRVMLRSVQSLSTEVHALEERSRLITAQCTETKTLLNRVAEVSGALQLDGEYRRTKLGEIGSALSRVEGNSDSTVNKITALRNEIVRETKQTAMDSVANIEALLQILPPAGDGPFLPSTGSWALSAKSMLQLIEIIRVNQPEHILELGGGTSTIWLGKELQRSGGHLYSVDHDEIFFQQTLGQISKHGISEQITPILAPLTESEGPDGKALWYNTEFIGPLPKIDLLIVDGPPGNSSRLARRPALYRLRDVLKPGAIIALDDAERPDELSVIEAWREDLGLIEIGLPFGRLRIFQLPNPAQ